MQLFSINLAHVSRSDVYGRTTCYFGKMYHVFFMQYNPVPAMKIPPSTPKMAYGKVQMKFVSGYFFKVKKSVQIKTACVSVTSSSQ